MFGNILIDKFRCYINVNPNDKVQTKCMKTHIEKILSKHYAPDAFYVNISKNYYRLSFEFTPTRYHETITDNEIDSETTDTNLEMPKETELLKLFESLFDNDFFREHVNKCKITKLDLTKNFLMKEAVKGYINKLIKRVYKRRYKAILHSSDTINKTLSITTLASNSEKSDKVGDREIIFYDKVLELKGYNINTVYLKEPLSEAEKAFIPLGVYCDKWLNLESLNILRVELQYASSNKLSDVSKFLGFKDSQKGLYFKDFFELLLNGELYEKLDDYYVATLTDIMLLNEPTSDNKLNIYQQIIRDKWDNVWDLQLNSVFKNNGLSKNYRKTLLKVQNTVKSPLIEELKAKIKGS